MQASNTTFQKIISGPKQFLIPVFQRDYKWREDNWQKLWDDIIMAGNAGHFAGSIVYVQVNSPPSMPKYLIIDGQQRLATLTVLCAALRDYIKRTTRCNNGVGPTAEQIDHYCLKNNQETGTLRYKLVLRRTDNETLRSVVDGNPLDEANGGESSLINRAYGYFCDRLNDPSIDPSKVYHGVISIRLVDMLLDKTIDNPQRIFESMNSTGVDLSQSDLVRNYLLMGQEEAEQTRLYEQYWQKIESLFRSHDTHLDSFIRDYIALKQKNLRQARTNQIYDEFKRFWHSDSNVEAQLQEMLRFAHYYAKFRGLTDDSSKISQALSRVRFHSDTMGVLIMRLFDCLENFGLGQDGLVTAFEAVESYLMRRTVAHLQNRGYWGIFASLARQIENNAPLDSLLFAFTQLQGANAFPSNDSFRQSLEESELYRLRRLCHYLLSRLENHGSMEPSPTDSYSVEHIMPQNEKLSPEWQRMLGDNWEEIHRLWLHRLGNLTLTAYNSQYSDKPFNEKKTISGGFNESAIRLNTYVRKKQEWTAEVMKERSQLLSKKALEIWKYQRPTPEYEKVRHLRRVKERAAASDVYSVPKTATAKNLFRRLHEEIKNLGDDIQAVHERYSVCYYTAGPQFFLELLPRKYYLMLLLDAEISEIDDCTGLTRDGNDWKHIPNSTGDHPYGVVVEMLESTSADKVIQIIRQAYDKFS